MPVFPFHQDDQPKPSHNGRSFSRHECHQIFKEMVRAELRNGPLAPRRRKRLIQYAAALHLKPLEASRIITSISRAEGISKAEGVETILPNRLRSVQPTDHDATNYHLPVWVKLVVPLTAAFLIDRLIRSLL